MLDTLKGQGYDPSSRSFFETGNARFFEDIEFEGEDRGYKVKDIIFEDEFIFENDQTFHTFAIENDQVPNIQDNIQGESLIQNEELAPVHEE